MSPRLPLIAGNWKMHKGPQETVAFCSALRAAFPDRARLAAETGQDREVAVFPPLVSLPAAAGSLAGTHIAVGAQNMHWERAGAYTGEVAAGFLKELGCRYVLVGHSERRRHFGETDEDCRRKVRAALGLGEPSLVPILCCGETEPERESGRTFPVVERQLQAALSGLAGAGFVVAYEPVWAIGTGRNAAPDQISEVHAFIRAWLARALSPDASERTRILYGGSVKPDNASVLLRRDDVDGALVGGASLVVEEFSRIVRF